MRIGINLLYLIPGIVGGTETYAAGLLHGLAQKNNEDEFIVFVNREAAEWPLPNKSNFYRFICPVTGTNRSMRYLFEQFYLPRLLRHHMIDLLHSLGYVGPILSPCPTVVTIPDLNYFDLAQTMPFVRRIILRFFSTQLARKANHIITISQFSKERICRVLNIPGEKITVIYLASGKMNSLEKPDSWLELAQLYGIKERYVVAFGVGPMHKNIPRLIQAFAILKDQFPHQFVLIGRLASDINLSNMTQETALQDRLITTGYVPRSHISLLLRHADLYVIPSLYEGFGIPVLEAQQSGVAVACSNAGSLPEVAGKGAVFFDPSLVESITQTMIRCLSDNNLRANLVRLGRENIRRFSWEKTAAETLAVYQQVIRLKLNSKKGGN